MPESGRTNLWSISLGHFFADFCQGAIPAMIPFLIAERHFTYAAAAGLVFANNISSSLIQPVFGHMTDRKAAPWLMPGGLFLAGVGLAMSGWLPGYAGIIAAMLLSGIGVAAFHPEAARLVHLGSRGKMARAMSVFSVGGNLGFAAGPLAATAALLAAGLRGTALLLIPVLTGAVVLFARLSAWQTSPSDGTAHGHPAYSTRGNQWGAFLRLLGALICRSVVFYGFNTFLPLYWIHVMGGTKAEGGLILTLLLGVGAVGTLLGGWLADRVQGRLVVLVSLGVLTPLMLGFVSCHSRTAAALFLVPIGLALFAPFSVMVVLGQEFLPRKVGTASGVTFGLAVTVGGLATPILGHIADGHGLSVLLFVVALVPILAFAMAATLPSPAATRERVTAPTSSPTAGG